MAKVNDLTVYPLTTPLLADRFNFITAATPEKYRQGSLTALKTLLGITYDTRALLAAATVDAGVNIVGTGGFATVGDGGASTYKRVGSEPSHALKVQSVGDVWWEIVPNSGTGGVSFPACGGVEGDVVGNGAANVAAFNNFIGYAQTFSFGNANQTTAPVLFIPRGHYHFNDHLNVKASCHIIGESGFGIIAAGGTHLEFVAEKHGFIFHREDTIDLTSQTGDFHSRGSTIQRLYMIGGGNTGAVGSGIWMRTPIAAKDVQIVGFAEHGIKVEASVGGGPSTLGNANLWRLENVLAASNGGNGLFVELPDANVGLVMGGDFHDNARWGVYASEAFGSTYIGVHTSGNGHSGRGGNPALSSSFVHFGGRRYSANVGASEQDLVDTEPGTDETVWIDTNGGGSTAQIPTWVVDQDAGIYFHGGSFRTEGASNQSLFLGCYRETNHGVAQILDPAIAIGGLMSGIRGTGLQINNQKFIGNVAFPNHETNFETTVRDITLDVNPQANKILRVTTEGDTSQQFSFLQWDETDKVYHICRHGTADSAIRITTDLSTGITAGRSAALAGGDIIFGHGLFVGDTKANARQITNATVVPASLVRGRGDIVWNRNMTVGDPMGWVCTVAGTPGTWVEIRGVANQTSDADQAALTDSTGGTGDGTLSAITAGGTGQAAGGWDTAANRDLAIGIIEDNFTELHLLLDQVRTTLVTNGMMKGSA